MEQLLEVIEKAKSAFRARLQVCANQGGMTREVYTRYLSFQYHLTKGVQKHFLACAGHPEMSNKRKLRDFLYRFGLEEEPHYYIAELDLRQLGVEPLPCPLDVALWWTYYDSVVPHRPFVRLGATCVLENLGAGAGNLGRELLAAAPFLNKDNTRFLEIHFHEALPHGDQIIGALLSVKLSPRDLDDLVEGANTGTVLYLRMAEWALGISELADLFPVNLTDFHRQNQDEVIYDDLGYPQEV
jgi:hypothetical protein